mgnify:CR=1 FL=1
MIDSIGENRGAAALRRRLLGDGIVMTWFTMGSVPLVELATRQMGAVAVIDLQHGLWDRSSLHLAVSCADGPIMVRSPDALSASIGAALDSGAAGVLVPSISTEAQALAAVNAARFPPHGTRSGGGVHPLGLGFSTYYSRSESTVVGLMIESLEGVENAATIAAVSGVDFLFVGTGDLSLSIGCFPAVDERLEEACLKVRDACHSAGKPCGIFTGSAEAARRMLLSGYSAVVAADDVGVVKAGFSAAADVVGAW